MAQQLPSSASKRAFYRFTFEIKDNGKSTYRHTLLVNPEDMSVDEPNRTNVTQTLGGAYVSRFGQGLNTVSISGKTGYGARKSADGFITDGYMELRSLRHAMYRTFIKSKSSKIKMYWYNWSDEEYYEIEPLSMRIQQNTSTGLMYRYEFQFMCLKRLGEQKKPRTANLISAVKALEAGQKAIEAISALSEALYSVKN